MLYRRTLLHVVSSNRPLRFNAARIPDIVICHPVIAFLRYQIQETMSSSNGDPSDSFIHYMQLMKAQLHVAANMIEARMMEVPAPVLPAETLFWQYDQFHMVQTWFRALPFDFLRILHEYTNPSRVLPPVEAGNSRTSLTRAIQAGWKPRDDDMDIRLGHLIDDTMHAIRTPPLLFAPLLSRAIPPLPDQPVEDTSARLASVRAARRAYEYIRYISAAARDPDIQAELEEAQYVVFLRVSTSGSWHMLTAPLACILGLRLQYAGASSGSAIFSTCLRYRSMVVEEQGQDNDIEHHLWYGDIFHLHLGYINAVGLRYLSAQKATNLGQGLRRSEVIALCQGG